MKTHLVNEKTHTHTYMHTARGLSCKWEATMRCSFFCCCCFSPCCYLRAWVFDPSENVCCFVPHSCLIFVSSFLAASLCRLVFACLFNYHRKDIKRSFISLVRLWPELSSQSKQRKCGLKNGLALPAGVATRLLLSLFSFPFDPVGECWNLSCWWIVAHCAPLQLCRPSSWQA